jgi:hypothetical protein
MEITLQNGVAYRKYVFPDSSNLLDLTSSQFLIPMEPDGQKIPTWFLQMVRNPATKRFQPAFALYRADKYDEPTIMNIVSTPKFKSIMGTCSYCQMANELEKNLGINFDQAPEVSSSPVPVQAQNITPTRNMDLGNIVTPNVIPTAVDFVSKIFCSTLGESLLKIGLAGLASMAAGWSSEGGTAEAWRKISNDLITTYNVCPADVPKIQQDIMRIKDAMEKDKKSLVSAVASGTVKSFNAIAKEHGMEFDATATLSGKARVAPMRRSGDAIG